MSADLRVKVVTPQGPVVNELVSGITACSEDGEFCVLPEHRPILAALKAGRMVLEVNGKTKVFANDVGFFEGGLDHANVMTQHCVAKDDVVLEEAQKSLAALQSELDSLPQDSAKRAPLTASIAWVEAQIKVAKES